MSGPGRGELVARGMAASTRRGYVQAFKDFHRFLVARKAAEIEATFGVVLDDPVDEFNAARHVGNDVAVDEAAADAGADGGVLRFPAAAGGDGPQVRSAGRDYALFRTLYHCRGACR